MASRYGLEIGDDYENLATNMATEYGYDSLEDFEADYDKEEVISYLTYERVSDLLLTENNYIAEFTH